MHGSWPLVQHLEKVSTISTATQAKRKQYVRRTSELNQKTGNITDHECFGQPLIPDQAI